MFKPGKIFLLIALLIVITVGRSVGAVYPVGDLNEDCKVDLKDMAVMAGQWLDQAGCAGHPDDCADLVGSDGVNVGDLEELAGNWLTSVSPVVINEFMADNDGFVEDPNGDDDDWLEIYNRGNIAVDVGGMYLEDDHIRWQIPGDDPSATTIDSHGFLLFWADNEPDEGTLHIGFGLGKGGDEISLYDADENLLDSIVFGAQQSNHSYGRLPDGDDNWQVFEPGSSSPPTPGTSNSGVSLAGRIVISEIMYHPYNSGHPDVEDVLEEYIELYNQGDVAVNLTDSRLSDGVEFVFAGPTVLEPDAYLVVAADVTTFMSKYPAVTNVVGSWTGKLRNAGEAVEMVDSLGVRVDRVRYADQGEWAVRELSPLSYNHRGWDWSDEHDGLGKSLELINAAMPNEYGPNWAASTTEHGTPGAVNSVTAVETAPFILDVKHRPFIPRSDEAVTVTAQVIDELSSGCTVTLHYRVDDSTFELNTYPEYNPGDYTTVAMLDDGMHADGEAGDGVYGAEIGVHPNGDIIEFFVEAVDGAANSRTWPAPCMVDGSPEQVANVLYQVNDSFDPQADWPADAQPIFYLIVTNEEFGRIEYIGHHDPDRFSDAHMNGTFISIDGIDMKMRYNVGIRNRGGGTGVDPSGPNNYRVNFAHDRSWKDVTAINLNSKYGHLQLAGAVIMRMAGFPSAQATAVQVRVNGQDLALTEPDPEVMYGSYVYLGVLDSDFAQEHFPDDSEGNLYKAAHYPWTVDLSYLGTDPAAYIDRGYNKLTNEAEYDWTDLIDLTNVLDNEPDETYVEEVNRVVNVDYWLRWFAAQSLIGNNETNLGSGKPDDFRMYRPAIDTRFLLLGYDLDTVLGKGDNPFNPTDSIFRAADPGYLPVIERFLTHPEFVGRYYGQLKKLVETVFSSEQIDPLLDHLLGGYVSPSAIEEMKQFVVTRNANVLGQIPQTFSISSDLPIVSGFHQTASSATSLYGTANAIETYGVRVNGQLAQWDQMDGAWSIGGTVALNPGINRVIVQTYGDSEGTGSELARDHIDIWYYDGTEVILGGGTLPGTMLLDAASGPWHLTGNVVVPAAVTLTIEAGTTLFFDSGAGITVNGRLAAQGSEYQRIRLSRVPGGSNWYGVSFNNTLEDNRLYYVDLDYGNGQGQAVNVSYSKLTIDNMTWAGFDDEVVDMSHPRVIIRNSYIPGMNAEPIHGMYLEGDEYLILEGNVFGTGINGGDIVDWDTSADDRTYFYAINNTLLGGGDDGIDLDGTEAYLEGNVFTGFHYNTTRETTSNAVSAGKPYSGAPNRSDITLVRNIFFDNDHGVMMKEDAYAYCYHNVFVDSTSAPIQFWEFPGDSNVGPARGGYIDGNVFLNYLNLFNHQFWTGGGGYPDPNIVVNRSLVPQEFHYLGEGNIDDNPCFVDEQSDFRLRDCSPGIGAGINGLDMGPYVPAGASVHGEPGPVTYRTDATLTVGGPAITDYKYRVKDDDAWSDAWSGEISVDVPIELTGLEDGHSYSVYVLGKNTAGLWPGDPLVNLPADPAGNASHTWTIDLSYSSLVINEILAHSQAGASDLIELYYDGPGPLDMGGMTISDDPNEPSKFIFDDGSSINPGEYLVLYADANTAQPGILGFALDNRGEGVWLYESEANGGELIDSVEFSNQLDGLSIGRIGRDRDWMLTQPTFGSANVRKSLGNPATLKINEWFTDGQVLFQDDFIELYNVDMLPVDLSDLYLTDNPQMQPNKHRLGPLSFVDGSGFVMFRTDDRSTAGHVDFKLSTTGEMIGLFDAELNPIDVIIYGSQTTDVSQGRTGDGADKLKFFTLPTPGLTNTRIETTTETTTLITEDAEKKVLVPTSGDDAIIGDTWRDGQPFDHSGWTHGTTLPTPGTLGGVGYDELTDYDLYITYDVESLMNNINPTCYIRIPFVVDAEDLTDFTSLELSARCDDGFVAFINGVEAADINKPSSLTWNSSCVNRSDSTAFVDFDVSDHISDLVAGDNILAIHALNQDAGSSDFLISVKLSGSVTTTIVEDPFADDRDVLAGLRITEIMYHEPLSDPNTEFIELYNVSDVPIDLTGVRFTTGVEFTFPSMTLAPGEYVLVVVDPVAFEAKYGSGPLIAGQYTGRLSNGGEEIVLELALPLDIAILRFDYDDLWYPATDGSGFALEIIDPTANLSTWDNPESWQTGSTLGGTPGTN